MNNKYTSQIAGYLDVDQSQVHLYWKGRVALYALLQAMGVEKGDEVIIPAFTCVVVPNAILYLGAKPVYVDINVSDYNMDVAQLEAAITDNTKVILVQNTYGLSTHVKEVVAIAKERKLYTIEDCTHGFGGTYDGKPNGSYCDAAFYSTQWNKPYSTGIGGFSVVANSLINSKVEAINLKLVEPSFKEVMSLRVQLMLKRYFLTESNYWKALKLYRYLSSKNLVVGSSSGEEISGIDMPENFFKASANLQARFGYGALAKLDGVLKKRKLTAEKYTQLLKNHSKNFVKPDLMKNHSFLKYPLRVNDRDKFFELAELAQISLGDWFTSPIHPVRENLELWGFDSNKFPVATQAAEDVVNLPTDIDERAASKVLVFLENHLNLIVDA